MSRPHFPRDHFFSRANGFLDNGPQRLNEVEEADAAATIAVEHSGSGSQSPSTSPSSASLPMSSCGQYMLHRVGRFDTLAGVAIKYGVEVADIKRLNGFSTDLQMFAYKTLRIPLPGRHPASPFHQHGSYEYDDRGCSPTPRLYDDLLDSILKTPRHKVSSTTSLLQGYYGLSPPAKRNSTHEGTEMAVYGKGKSVCLDDEPWSAELPKPSTSQLQQKTGTHAIGSFVNVEAEEFEDSERPIRLFQKADGELVPREENGSALLSRAGRGLALRPKSGNRPDTNKSHQNLLALTEPYERLLQTVKKSSSTPEFQEPESNNSSSIWSTNKWRLKPDTFSLPLPLFDNIPKPISAWKNKAARD